MVTMNSSNKTNETTEDLCSVVSSYLDLYVSAPALETVQKNIKGQAQIASLGAMLSIVADHIYAHGIDYNKQYLADLPKEEIEARIKSFGQFIELQENNTEKTADITRSTMDYINNDSSRKYLLNYLMREINWITISLLSGSYISALILMRSTFELTVGIATRETGGMTDRIYSIPYLKDNEKKIIKDHWFRLCAWGHPFGKWQKEVCPIFVSHKPSYHPILFSLCLDEFVQLLDFFLVVAVVKYELGIADLKREFSESHIDLSGLNLFCHRAAA